jgi:hypothetical protein
MQRILWSSVAIVIGLGIGAFGVPGWGGAAICDTNCPSDLRVLAYKVTAYVGAATVVAGAGYLGLSQLRLRRR